MDSTAQRSSVTFVCSTCDYKWAAAPDRVEDFAEDDVHPWAYFCACPRCGEDAGQLPQERNLFKAWSKSTGPRTSAGIAAVTKNLEGHPTPEEARRTRFNAMKHGVYARTATYFPARPGKYPQCDGCQYFVECSGSVACLKKTELFLRTHIAFETRDPGLLTEINADIQSMVHSLVQDILLAIVGEGVQLKSPKFVYDKDGDIHWVEYLDSTGEKQPLYDIAAHPLLKTLKDMLSANGMTLSDLAMTPKVQEDNNIEMGNLERQGQSRDALLAFQQRQTEALEKLPAMIARGQDRIKKDTVFIDHQEGE